MSRKNILSTYFTAFIIVSLPSLSTTDLVIKEEIPSLDKLRVDNEEALETPDLSKLTAKKTESQLLTEQEMEKWKIWPRGVIPYYIDDFSFDKVLRDRIRSFLEETTEKTGLQFVEMPSPPENDDSRWVFFINRRGVLQCGDLNSSNFTNKGVQRVVLGYDCLGAGGGALAATVLALAGVPPQHNAPDRDKHIQIIFDNVIPEKNELFRTLPSEMWPFKDNFNYDFESAGHYDFYKHTKNGKMTIKPLRNVPSSIGDAKGLSRTDILKMKFLYEKISQKPKPNISEDCSKMYKRGRKPNKHELEDAQRKRKLKFDRGYKGLKAKIEKELDFDTDVDT